MIEVIDVVRLVERVDGTTDIVVEVVWVVVEAVRLWEPAELVEPVSPLSVLQRL